MKSWSNPLATEKQIAANRANAKFSTGPKTTTGKLKSSRNAFRHGLSGPVSLNALEAAKINLIAGQLTGDQATRGRLTWALEYVGAQMEVLRIHEIRTKQFARVALDNLHNLSDKELRRLAALDRYERYAYTKRRRAWKRLQSKG